jgi:acyl carrier protein
LDDLRRAVVEAIAPWAAKSPANILDPDDFEHDLLFDSLDWIEAVMTVEDRFGVEIDLDAPDLPRTVGALVAAVRTQMAGRAA